ncbi:MAG: SDR family oxidoreductase [bacterium]
MADGVLAGKRALVTGAGRGIGREIALAMARAGATVAIAARTDAELLAVAGEIEAAGGNVLSVTTDISSEDSVKALASTLTAEWGYLDIVINNAASFARRLVTETSLESWNRVIGTNLTGTFLVTRETLPLMRNAKGGTIIFVSSTAGKRGYGEGSAYAASKHGLMGLAHSLLYEVRGENIRVVVISPSVVDTRRADRTGVAHGGKGVLLRAEDVAQTVLFACALPGRALVRDIELWGTNP